VNRDSLSVLFCPNGAETGLYPDENYVKNVKNKHN
jgi:hypothetical protein